MDGTPPTSPQAAARRCAGLALTLLALLAGPAARPAAAVPLTPVMPSGGPDPSVTWPVSGPAIRTALEVGRAHWGGVPCHGDVRTEWRDLSPALNAQALWVNMESQWDRPDLNIECELQLNRRVAWDWPKLCTVVVHELGHLMGHDHAGRPDDVMYPYYMQTVIDCRAEPEPPTGPGAPAAAPTGSRPAAAARSKRRASPRRTTKRRAARKHPGRSGRASR